MAGWDDYYTNDTTAATVVWKVWTAASGTTYTATTTTDDCWVYWCNNESTTATTSDTCWREWNSSYRPLPAKRVAPKPETEEEKAARLAKQEAARIERERKAAEEAARKKAAEERAHQLLLEYLPQEERERLQRDNVFHVIASDGTRYEVDPRRLAGNVAKLDAEGKRVERLCIHLHGDTPLADNALAQKLALEADVRAFRNTANITQLAA